MRIRDLGHFWDGKPVFSSASRSQNVLNPANAQVTARLALALANDVNAARAAASEAFPAWSAVPAVRRARLMNPFPGLLYQRKDDLAKAITAEHGNVVRDARGAAERGIDIVEFACGMPQLLKGDFSGQVSTGIDNWTCREPLGVVAGITPFNFPVMVPMWMFPVAIATGNTFVLKPSPLDPTPSLLCAERMQEAGFPMGVFNVVQGGKVAVDALLEHPAVQAISFVGSTPIANYEYETCARHGKRVQALGGAKNHMLLMPDADLQKAADAFMGAAYVSAGERCMAISVAVLVGDVGSVLSFCWRIGCQRSSSRTGRIPRQKWGESCPKRPVNEYSDLFGRGSRKALSWWLTGAIARRHVPRQAFGWGHAFRPHHSQYEHLPRSDLRARPVLHSPYRPRAGHPPDQRAPVRQRRKPRHARRAYGA